MGKILLHEESEANVSDSFLKDVSNRDQKWNVGKSFTVRRIWVWALQIVFKCLFIRHFNMNYLQFYFNLESQ